MCRQKMSVKTKCLYIYNKLVNPRRNEQSHQKCQNMLIDVAKYINLAETEYFSFRYVDEDLHSVWVDLDQTIGAQFKSIWIEDNEIVVYFNVKFYIADPCKLTYELTRWLISLAF